MDVQLDILGQQPALNIYTQICLCYRLTDHSSRPTIIRQLTTGLEKISNSVPWIAGQVVNEGSSEGNSGIYKIKPLERIPRFTIKDLRNEPGAPTMDTLRKARFPFSMLDENVIAPINTFPGSTACYPVFALQANIIDGGLLLTIVAHHQTMDMRGQGQIIHLLSKACRNEPFTNDELSSGNLARHNLVPLLDDDDDKAAELCRQMMGTTPSQPASESRTDSVMPAPPLKCIWAYFTFPHSSLAALKAAATETIVDTSRFVSTDDALSAFVWQSILRARVPRFNVEAKCTLARAVSVRKFFGVPQTYTGLLQNMTYHTYALQDLINASLGEVALNLRLALDPETSNLELHTRALATTLHRSPDKSAVAFPSSLDLSIDIMLSSWAQVDCYNEDFNLGLGKPEAVRRPQFPPAESLGYFMPRTLDGEIALGICLREEDMEKLVADEEFMKYGLHIA